MLFTGTSFVNTVCNVDRLTVNNPGPVNVSVCAPNPNVGDDCCGEWTSTVEVKFCEAPTNDSSQFYVYRLKNVPFCDMAYCTEKVPIPHTSKPHFNCYNRPRIRLSLIHI